MPHIPREPERFEALQWLGRICHIEGRTLHDPASIDSLLAAVREKLVEVITDPVRLSGLVHESIFENTVIELGQAKFLKREDTGSVYADTTALDGVKPPDFRVTLHDDRRLLVEVKAHKTSFEPGKGLKIPKKEFARQIEYAQRAGGELWFATFWEGIEEWTLNAPTDFRRKGKDYVIDVGPALKANCMALLGDVSVATVPPLRMRIVADPDKPRQLDDLGLAEFTIGRVDLFCNGELIEDPAGSTLAFYMFMFGKWDAPKSDVELDGRDLVAVNWTVEPIECVEDQELQIVGTASSMYARMFKVFATDEQGRYNKLCLPATQGRMRRITPPDFPFGESALRLWIFEQRQ